MPLLEDIEKLVTPELLCRFAFEVGWARRGTDECLCPHCRAPLEFISEGPLARWRCCGKKAHGGGSLELVMIGRGLSAPDAQALLAGRVGLANYPAGLATRAREPEREPRPKRVKRGQPRPRRSHESDRRDQRRSSQNTLHNRLALLPLGQPTFQSSQAPCALLSMRLAQERPYASSRCGVSPNLARF